MGIEENKAIVTELYRRMNDREYEQMWDDLFTPDAVWGAGRYATDAFGGIEKMKPLLVDPMPAFEDGGMHFTVHALTAEADRVAAEVESIRYMGELPVRAGNFIEVAARVKAVRGPLPRVRAAAWPGGATSSSRTRAASSGCWSRSSASRLNASW